MVRQVLRFYLLFAMLCFTSSASVSAAHRFAPSRQEPSQPRVVDLSKDMPPIGDQGPQDSCVAWAVGYYYKSFQERRLQGWNYSNDTVFSPSYLYNQLADNNETTLFFNDAFRILQEEGITPLSAFGTNTGTTEPKPDDDARRAAAPFRIAGFQRIPREGGNQFLDDIKAHLATGDPVVMGLPLAVPGFTVPVVGWDVRIAKLTPTIIDLPSDTRDLRYNHAVILVGYDDDKHRLKFANSWGSTWGENGYGYITYQYVVEFSRDVEAYTMQSIAWRSHVVATPLPSVVKSGETFTATIELQNTSTVEWPVNGTVRLRHLRGNSFGLPNELQFDQPIPVGGILSVPLSLTAPEAIGPHDGIWQMSQEGRAFGDELTLSVVVAPAEGSSLGEEFKALVEGARKELAQQFDTAWKDLKARIQQRIEEEIRKEVDRRLAALCGTAPAGLIFASSFLGLRRWRRGRKSL